MGGEIASLSEFFEEVAGIKKRVVPDKKFDSVCNIKVTFKGLKEGKPWTEAKGARVDTTYFPDVHEATFFIPIGVEQMTGKVTDLESLMWNIEQMLVRVSRASFVLERVILMPSPVDGSRINMRAFGSNPRLQKS